MTSGGGVPTWMCDEGLRPLAARLAQTTALPRVVSFDFFDTLVFRLCAEPADLFVEVGRQLARQGLLRLRLSPSEYRAARVAAEEKAREAVARKGRCPEVNLSAIYDELRGVLVDPAAARDLEFRIERSLCFLNPAMASLVRQVRALGCRTAIVSDTYFTSTELLGLLEGQDVSPSLFDAVFASSEHGKAKWFNGTLYQEVLRRFDLHPGELLHIGDDMISDLEKARRLGIETRHYGRTTTDQKSVFVGEQKLAGYEPGAGSVNSLRVMCARRANGDDDAFRDGAAVFGPVLSRFADWCVEHYARAGVRRVLALMREGELLGELVKRAAEASGVSLEVVICYTSRLATARASMSTVDVESAAALLEGSQQISPQTILDILGLSKEGEGFLDPEGRKRPLPSHQASKRFLDALFQLPSIRNLIESRQRESHGLAFEYLSSLAGDESTIGILDLGWSGSIQRNIARILGQGGRPVTTVGCYLACSRRAGRLPLEGHEAHAYLDRHWNRGARSAILPEVCINASVGSTSGYSRDAAGQVQPVFEPTAISAEQKALKTRLREGVLAFQALWLELRRRSGSTWSAELLADLDRHSPAILHRFLDYPTKPEADRLGALYHDENYFGAMNDAPLCDEESRNRLRRHGAQALFQDARCYWPQGVMAQLYPRLLSALRQGFEDPLVMGTLGAFDCLADGDAGLTADETDSLAPVLARFAPSQIVFCGPVTARIASLLLGVQSGKEARASLGGAPSVIFAGPAGREPPATAGNAVAQVGGDLGHGSTLAGIRALLSPETSAALIVTGDVSELDAKTLLSGLAPFLGPQGVALLACGRYDRRSIETSGILMKSDNPLERAAKEWFETLSSDLGFGLWNGEVRWRAHLRNWIVLLRATHEMAWSGQWMGTVADLAFAEETGAPGEEISGADHARAAGNPDRSASTVEP